MSLYARTMGAGREIVLVHGWGMNAAVWEPLLAHLQRRARVTVLELPGHGASAPLEASGLQAWVAVCAAAAPPAAIWLGWSLGGQIALQMALQHPERVTGLFLLATTPRFVQADDWPSAMPAAVFAQFSGLLVTDPVATLQRFLALQVKGAEHAHDTLRLLRAEIAARPPASPAGLTQGLALLLQTDLRAAMGALCCPSAWIFGARDTLVPVTAAAAVTGLLPQAQIAVVAGAGHAPFLSHPAECLAVLDDFLLNQVAAV